MANGNKVLVLGLDGMEPYTTKRMIDAGKMPNTKKLLERGAARADLELLGAMPTITPAQWTTLACGCYPGVHGVTDFWNQAPDALDTIIYGLDSRLCQAEQLWNVTAEAGKKTLVWQWSGSSGPPSSQRENLFVVDGTQPASVNYSIANIDIEKNVVASKEFTENSFIDHIGAKNLGDAATDCVIDKLDLEEDNEDDAHKYDDFKFTAENKQEFLLNRYKMKRIKNVDFHPIDNNGGALAKVPFDKIESTISEPSNWGFELPAGALEFVTYTAGGQLRRPCLILPNAEGKYDTVKVYKSKKDAEPLCTLQGDKIAKDVLDDCIENGNDTTEVDFSKTKAVAIRTSYIWINLKGRDEFGIVDPADKYDIEEQIIDDLYRYRDENGDRIIAMAFHNKDAKVIGLDGQYTGDIIYMNRERYVTEHGQGLSTYRGYYGTSVSPIFIAAGKGIMHDEYVKRTIRQVDVAPTVATLLDVRMPKDCEGAPVYQILEEYK